MSPISIHALHYRVRCDEVFHDNILYIISIHALHYRVRSRPMITHPSIWSISIHALHYRVRYRSPCTTCAHHPYFNPRTPLQSAIGATMVINKSHTKFQSTHSITECDRKIWCFGPQNPHLATKKYIKRRTNVLKEDTPALFIGANPLGKTCALRVHTKSQIINGSSRAKVCFAPYTSILP